MRILLVEPKDEKLQALELDKFLREDSFPPLNLQILAGLTPNEEVEIVDENFDEIDFDGDYDLVGLTGYGVFKIIRAKKIYEEFKKRKIPVVIGGSTVNHLPIREVLKYADSIVLGEGEGVWKGVVKDAKNNRLRRIYKSKKLIGLSKQHTLSRRDMTNNKNYTGQVVEIARGCPHNCDFCTIAKLNRGKYRVFPIERVLREVEQCLEYPAQIKRFIYFADDNLGAKSDYKIKLFKKLIHYNLAWQGLSDISIAKNKKLLNVLAKSGCLSIGIGFESINQESLSSVSKFVNRISEYKKAIKTIHNYGIKVSGSFMFGLDDDKPGVAKKTLDFILRTGIDSYPHIIMPVPGTRFFNTLDKKGRILTKDWSKYDGEHAVFQPKNMAPEQLEEEYKWFIDHAPRSSVLTYLKRVLTGEYVLNKNVSFITRILLLLRRIHRKTLRLY